MMSRAIHHPSLLCSAVSSSVLARLSARVRAGRYDQMLAVGAPVTAGSGLAVHAARLTSIAERDAVALALRNAVACSLRAAPPWTTRVPIQPMNVAAAEPVIDTILRRLSSPQPVSPRGMARLRRILSDGGGPLYRCGRGDLAGRLGAALAAL